MKTDKKIGAVIVAAGRGNRMGSRIPKQFLNIDGRPMVFHSVRVFLSCPWIHQVVLVTGEEYMGRCCRIFFSGSYDAFNEPDDSKLMITRGGRERSDSVRAGLTALDGDVEYVLVHDGARPYVSFEVLETVAKEMIRTGAAVPAIRPKDTIRTRSRTLDRNELFAVQTPEGFKRSVLEEGYVQGEKDGFQGTDDASYVERLGIPVTLVSGDSANIKITTRADLPKDRETFIGNGYDVHPLVPGVPLILGGVKIPHDKGLSSHSDGDVLTHALMDAMLGAAGLGDIGEIYPDSKEEFKGISSLKLLEDVSVRIGDKGFAMGNIDIVVMAQKPAITPYKEGIKKKLGDILNLSPKRINMKATTTEKLGFVGREEGIAAQVVCLLKR